LLDQPPTELDAALEGSAMGELPNSQLLWQSIVAHSPDTIMLTDATGCILYINRVLPSLKIHDVVGHSAFEFLSVANHDRFHQALRNACGLGQVDQFEHRAIDGSWWIARLAPLPDQPVPTVLIVSTDITRWKRADEMLREGAERFRLATECYPGPVMIYDAQGRVQFANTRAEQMIRRTRDEIVGKRDEEILPRQFTDSYRPYLLRAIETGDSQTVEVAAPRRKGGVHLVINFVPLANLHGQVQEVLAVGHDITRQKEVERELRCREREFRSLADSMPDVVARFDRELRHLFVNRQVEPRTGFTPQSFLGKSNRELPMPPDLVAKWDESMRQVLDSGRPAQIGFQFAVPRQVRHFESRIIPERNDSGSVETILVITRDVTDRCLAEQELQRYREHLEQLVQSRTRALEASQDMLRAAERLASLGTLAAGIAHEINNPVGTILLAAEMARVAQADGDDAVVARCLDGIAGDAQRCARIVKNVLGFARQSPTEKHLQSLNEVVERAAERMRGYLTSHDVTLHVALDPAVGDLPMNATAIDQVMGNLLQNAAESRTEPMNITVTTGVQDDHYTVAVADDGPGIPADVQAHVFDPFYTTRRAGGGTGLGLSIVHGNIKDHQGRVRVDSAPGVGTIFRIELPRHDAK
jgi:PAS domain S-box-containing protein